MTEQEKNLGMTKEEWEKEWKLRCAAFKSRGARDKKKWEKKHPHLV